jgi:hypothetical protein
MAMEFVLNSELRRQFEGESLDLERVQALLAESRQAKITLDLSTLGFALKAHLDRLSGQLQQSQDDVVLLQRIENVAVLAQAPPFEVNLWQPQNAYYNLLQAARVEQRRRAAEGDENAKAWLQHFDALGERLGFGPAPSAEEKPNPKIP